MYARIEKFLSRAIKRGTLEIVDASGKLHKYGDGAGKPVRVRFTSADAERNVANNPDLKLGEEYVDQGIRIEQGTLYDFLMVLFENVDGVIPPWPVVMRAAWRYLNRRHDQANTLSRSRHNVHSHYDLDGRLYRLFLDADMQYSCAYFEDGVVSLDEAQLAKKRHIAAKLDLKPGQRVLDIGSGWGGLGLYIAEHFDVNVTGVTLSDEQFAVSNQRAEERGLSNRVRFLLQDYRALQGSFDRVVSVGMFEHVGPSHYREFFRQLYALLPDEGIAVLHTIAKKNDPGPINPWIERHIFPGAYLPTLSELAPVIEREGLWLTDLENWRLHYARTLSAWNDRFQARRVEASAIYDERFCRMWEFYLQASELGFRLSGLCVFQMQFAKRIDVVPITRDYIYDRSAGIAKLHGD